MARPDQKWKEFDRCKTSCLDEKAANVMMTRCKADNWLKSWALGIARRRGARKAKVALARRLAVVLHRMWSDGTEFSMESPIAMVA